MFHIPLEVDVQEFEHEVKLCIGVYDVQESVERSVVLPATILGEARARCEVSRAFAGDRSS